MPPSLKVLRLADERQQFRHQDYRQGLAHLKNLKDVELTYNGEFAGFFPTFPSQLEKDLTAALGPGANVKVKSDQQDTDDDEDDNSSDGTCNLRQLLYDSYYCDYHDYDGPYDDFPTKDDWR